jgi:hypothetical protein
MPGRVLFGLLLIVLGVGYLLQVFGIITDLTAILRVWWPVVIIAVGLNWLARHARQPWWPLLVTAIGVLILLSRLLPDFARYFWPIAGAVALVVIGLRLLLPRKPRMYTPPPAPEHPPVEMVARQSSEDVLQYSVSFNGIEVCNSARAFRGGAVDVNFGSIRLDLRGAELAPEGGTLELRAAFAGIELLVPEHWVLDIMSAPAFGAVDDKRKNPKKASAGQPVLALWCHASFGGIEIKN